MFENQPDVSQLPPTTSWTVGYSKRERQRVVRRFINSAIYVEKEIVDMVPQRKTSPLEIASDIQRKCYCATICSCIGNLAQSEEIKTKTPESGYRTMEQSSNSSNEQSENSFTTEDTLTPANNFSNSDLRLSLSCLNTNRTSSLNPKERQEIVQNWIMKKEQQRKRKEIQEAKIAKQKEEERQLLLEKERENFKRWLAEKKKEEERKRLEKELEVEEQKLKEIQKEKKKVESEISYNIWLRNKRKDDLEKRITEKLALLRIYEEKQRRMEENEKAYQEWLQSSKTRQKPVPPNKGLQSLCSSTSVTYINPIPWTPNIDMNPK